MQIHARLGEILLMATKTSVLNDPRKQLAEALKRFCRSVELCDNHLRGYYGLKLVSGPLLLVRNSLSQRSNLEN